MVAAICMVCFLVRTILLPVIQNNFGGSSFLFLVYFAFSEVIIPVLSTSLCMNMFWFPLELMTLNKSYRFCHSP